MAGPKGFNNKFVLSIGLIEELKRAGYNQNDIARAIGVSAQAVTYHKQTYNGSRTPREEVMEHFPWKVPEEFTNNSPYKRIRDHAEFIATGGEGMSQDKLSRLRGFYRKLRKQNAVLEFVPEIPPIKGVCNQGGFILRKRKPSDGDLIIRVNEYTDLTEEGEMIWRFPPVDP